MRSQHRSFSSSVSLLPRPPSAQKQTRRSIEKADGGNRPTVQHSLNEPDPARLFLETQRVRAAKMAVRLQAFLGQLQKPALAQKLPWARKSQIPPKKPASVMSKDDLTQLLKAEEVDRFQNAERRARQLRALVTIDDRAADELDMERRGTDAVQLTSDLHPGFADAAVRFGVLRHEIKDKAEERRAKANRLLSNVTSDLRHGVKRRPLRRARSRGFEDKPANEPEQESELPSDEDETNVMKRHRRELRKPIAKFDRWVEGHLRRQGLRPKTAPAKIA